MTAITTAAAGNWSASGTWTGGIVPGNGDTVTLNHNVTVDVDTTIGTSPAENSGTYAITWGAATKLLTLAAGVTLTVRGDCLAKGNTTKNNVVYMNAGSTWEFDASQAASPSSQNYRFVFGTASNQYTVFRAMGSSGSRCTIRSNASGGNAFFTRNALAPCGWLHAEYTDFVRMGDSTNPLLDYYLGNTSNAEMTLTNCTLDACGVVTSASAPTTNATIAITNTSFKNSAGTNPLVLPGFTNAGTKTITGCVFDKVVAFGQGAWTVEDNLFMEAYTSTAGTKWTSQARNAVRKSTQPTVNIYGDSTDELWFKAGTIANAHHLTYGVTTSLTVTGSIFATENSNAVGDAMQPGAPTGARLYRNVNCLLLPDETSGVQPGKLQGAGGNANVSIENEHCTYISTAAGETGTGYGETYAGYDGIVKTKSCLAWSPNTGEASIFIRQAGSVQQSSAANFVNNATWNGRSGTDALGYNSISAGTIFSGSPPGGSDVTLSGDPFVDRTRNVATWDAALGGPGTSANAFAELAKRNDASGYNSDYSITALTTWIKAGFAVTDASLLNAGHDGVTIGAGAFVHQATINVALALDLAATGTVASASGVTGTASVSLALSIAGTGTVPRTGASIAALAVNVSAAGAVGNTPITGVASAALTLGIAAAGTVPRTGTATAVLPVRVAATGTVPRTGTATVTFTLTAAASGAVGNVPRTGSAVLSLALRATSSGTVPRSGAAVLPISLAIAATGTVPRTGAALVALLLDVAAVGTVTTGAPYVGQIRLTAARGPALALYAGNGPTLSLAASNGAALRLTPQESVS